ncbi:CYFA0S31e00144g1_1 [Cyberlindnera fabianii]|uniref:ferric-chelate reductase (NADPH) n=1 Tax=Cyberlindnera fabianii TaxID=36022 RepID=A0A061BBH2_CYBFA|nr:CYFA0S31e00144g1_1 [Cyberlindnera fabianii]
MTIMLMNFQLIALVLLHLTFVESYTFHKTSKIGYKYKNVGQSCLNTVRSYTFEYSGKSNGKGKNAYDAICNYPPASGSVAMCVASFYHPMGRTFNKSMAYASRFCKSDDAAEMMISQYENATQYAVSLDDYPIKKTNFTMPVNVTREDNKSYGYISSYYYNWDMPNIYASAFYGFFLVVFAIHAFFNLLTRLGLFNHFNWSLIRMYKSYVSTPSLFSKNHTTASVSLHILSTLLPTRLETLIIILFSILNLILAMIKYDVNVYRLSYSQTLAINIADRTGLLSFGLIPLLILLAGRNNIVTSLTGVPYSTLIVYHKWTSRWMFIHAVVHSIAYTVSSVIGKDYSEQMKDPLWQWGVVATILGGILCFQAMHLFRSMAYETFLMLHIVLAAMFIVGCWYHCYSLGYLEWLLVSCVLWVSDRLLRLVRIFMFGLKTAQLEYADGNEDMFRVVLPIDNQEYAFPGSFAYLYFMTPYGFWQSHPFTLLQSAARPGNLVVTIKPKRGITRYLQKELSIDKTINIKVGVEGPYGHRAPLDKYQNVMLIAGGSGLPGLLAHALDLGSRDSIVKQNVSLIWVIQNLCDYNCFADEIAQVSRDINVEIYVTRVDEKVLETVDIIEKDTSNIVFKSGRPLLNEMISNQAKSDSLAIMSCGPPRMCDEVRQLASIAMFESQGTVDLFEELQVW